MIKHNIIITGLSGAGKTQALKILEDAGFYCVDNLPPNLIDGLFSYLSGGRSPNASKITPSLLAVGLDIRGLLLSAMRFCAPEKRGADVQDSALLRIPCHRKKISSLLTENLSLAEKTFRGFRTKIIFLDADTRTLLARYRITRRKHPIPGNLEKAIEVERRLLSNVKKHASAVIDTSNLSNQELSAALLKTIDKKIDRSPRGALSVKVVSFGYRFGLPSECDIVFDVRFLKNPNYEPRLKYLTGTDPRVARYIFGRGGDPSGQRFVRLLEGLLKFLVPRYIAEGKNYLSIGFGCTGGHHRSVAVAERIGKFLKEIGCETDIFHRDVDKPLVFA